MDSGWEDLRREARRLEADLDAKLSSFAKLRGQIESGSASDVLRDGSWKLIESEIDSLLKRLLVINDSMTRVASEVAPSTSMTQKLARHRDILNEFTQEFRRTRGTINSFRAHAELLTSVRNVDNEFKASEGSSPAVSLLRERATIYGNINQLDEVINQAQATKGALSSQRSMFIDIEGKLKHLGNQFPAIRDILGAIKRKKSKDTIILSAVIAACTIFLVIYWLSK